VWKKYLDKKHIIFRNDCEINAFPTGSYLPGEALDAEDIMIAAPGSLLPGASLQPGARVWRVPGETQRAAVQSGWREDSIYCIPHGRVIHANWQFELHLEFVSKGSN
jgi:hypothetical protein